MGFFVDIKPPARKGLNQLSSGQFKSIAPKINELETNSKPHGSVELKKFPGYWRVKHRGVRAVYLQPVDNQIDVLFISADHKAYDDLKKLIAGEITLESTEQKPKMYLRDYLL